MAASVWLIAGPTASGKSALALLLAEALGGEVVNADSMQLYADLQVLTARPSPAELARAPHHLYGVADAADAWSVGRWLEAARRTLAEITVRGRHAIVVGGTGLYFRALTQGLAEAPPVPETVRAEVGARYDVQGEAAFRARLREGDPASDARIQLGDRQRLIRAAAVLEATRKPLTDWRGTGVASLQPGDYAAAVLEPPRAELYACCDARLDAMIEAGALEEVAALHARGLSGELPAMKALGVRQFIDHLDGRCSLDAALANAKKDTRRYVKRQSTWFRNQTPDWPRVRSLDAEGQQNALQQALEVCNA